MSRPAQKKLPFENDEAVLCYHGPLMYEAKILRGEWKEDGTAHYFVHYKGWKATWDEWVSEARVFKDNEENRQKQKEAQFQKGKKRQNEKEEPQPTKAASTTERQPKKAKSAEPQQKLDLQFAMPEELVKFLVDDWENITKQQKLVPLPKDHSVAKILKDFLEAEPSRMADDGLLEIVEGLKLYFDTALGKMLLYRFERQQYAELRKQDKRRLCEIYGCEHLLRLYVHLPNLLEQTDMSKEAATDISNHLSDLIRFIHKHSSVYLTTAYENAPPEYTSMSKNN